MNEESEDPQFDGSDPGVASRHEEADSQFLVAALLVYVAKGDGNISDMETGKMLGLMEEHFQLQSADSLALLTRALTALAEHPDLDQRLRRLSTVLTDSDKEEIAVMLLQVVAADGEKDAAEMEKMDLAAEIVDISPDVMHRAFDRYFDEALD